MTVERSPSTVEWLRRRAKHSLCRKAKGYYTEKAKGHALLIFYSAWKTRSLVVMAHNHWEVKLIIMRGRRESLIWECERVPLLACYSVWRWKIIDISISFLFLSCIRCWVGMNALRVRWPLSDNAYLQIKRGVRGYSPSNSPACW